MTGEQEATHEYVVEPSPAGAWRVMKRPIGGGGGTILATYKPESRSIAETLAGVLAAFQERESER